MLYAVKIEFDTESSIGAGIKILTFDNKMQAAGMFNAMSYAYALAQPVRNKKTGKKVDILGAWIYEVDTEDSEKAIEIVKSGMATLIDEAPEIAFDFDDD